MSVYGAVLPRGREWALYEYTPLRWLQGEFTDTKYGHSSKYQPERKCFISPPWLEALKTYLMYNSMNSQQLVEKFFEKKVSEQVRWQVAGSGFDQPRVGVQRLCYLCVWQKGYSGEKYGAVTLLAFYRKSDHRLRVEVLNAVNLLPMDSNGKTHSPGVHRSVVAWRWSKAVSGVSVRLQWSVCAADSGTEPRFSCSGDSLHPGQKLRSQPPFRRIVWIVSHVRPQVSVL